MLLVRFIGKLAEVHNGPKATGKLAIAHIIVEIMLMVRFIGKIVEVHIGPTVAGELVIVVLMLLVR